MQQAKEAAKDVAVKKEASLPTNFNLEEMAGQGQEFVTARDTKLPILKILYANSPVLDESDGKYIESAKQGDIYNETSGNLYKGKDGLIVVPCLYINTFNEWKDRGESPGRPVGIHTDPSIMSQTNRGDDGKDRLENGNYVEDTGNHFVYVLDKDYIPVETALISMKSTQKKKSKTWNSMIASRRLQGKKGFFTPPSWATAYKLKTTKESNSQNSWYGWTIEFDSVLDPSKSLDALQTSKAFYESCKKQDIFSKVAFEEDGKVQIKKVSSSEATPF